MEGSLNEMERWMFINEQEFPFVKGRMLLRGSNGSGKSVTMQSVVPLLLDGNMSPERLDPFGSRDRKMSSYLLEENDGREERTGYLYLEFKRKDSETYLTIGMGIRAKRNKPLDKWYFSLTDGRRIGKENLKEWRRLLWLCANLYNALPYRTQKSVYLAVFAAAVTGNPHAFDQGTAEGKILYQVIQMDLGQRGIQVETLEMFPAYKRQKSYLLAGILIDDISNYALLYNVHAIKKNGELHRGMDGFCQEKNMVQVPLTVLSEWERIECVDHEIFIVENPSVFALICGEKSCMCMNGQPRLAGLLVLELLAKSGTKVYYSGDLDPEGILIAQKLSQYYRGTFCYWHMTPFDYEQCRSKEIISEKRKKMLQKITDERLLPVVDAVTKYGVAGYQESIGLNQISI